MGLSSLFDVILDFLEELFALIFSFVAQLDGLDGEDDDEEGDD